MGGIFKYNVNIAILFSHSMSEEAAKLAAVFLHRRNHGLTNLREGDRVVLADEMPLFRQALAGLDRGVEALLLEGRWVVPFLNHQTTGLQTIE